MTRAFADVQPAPHDKLFAELRREGALVLRPLGDETPHGFARFASALQMHPFDASESAAVRTPVVPPYVFTANEAPPDAPVPFHHEMSQCTRWPRYVLFYCDTPATAGGSTPIARSDELARACRRQYPEACRDLTRRGIRYVRTLPPTDDPTSPIGRAWSSALNVTGADQVPRALHERKLTGEWMKDGALRLSTGTRTVFRRFGDDPEVFFNSAVAARAGWRDARNHPHTAIRFGDGAKLSPDAEAVFDFAEEWLEENAERHAWRAGDILLLDNHRVLHAREPYTPPRRVLATLWGSRMATRSSL